jgi:hypothetical protein
MCCRINCYQEGTKLQGGLEEAISCPWTCFNIHNSLSALLWMFHHLIPSPNFPHNGSLTQRTSSHDVLSSDWLAATKNKRNVCCGPWWSNILAMSLFQHTKSIFALLWKFHHPGLFPLSPQHNGGWIATHIQSKCAVVLPATKKTTSSAKWVWWSNILP